MINEAQGIHLVYNGNVEKTQMSERFDNIDQPVYEVMSVKEGIVLFIEDHIKRLKHTLKTKDVLPVRSIDQILEDIDLLVNKNSIDTGFIKMLITNDEVLVYEHWDLDPKKSIEVSILDYERDNPSLKILDNEYKAQVNNLMMEQDTYEVLLRTGKGELIEGGRSNLYFIKDNKVITAPEERVLPGITRGRINSILEDLDIILE